MKQFSVFLIIFIHQYSVAQTEYIDSLKLRTESTKLADSLVVDASTQLGNALLALERPDEAKIYADRALKLSSAINYKKGTLNSINVLASYYSDIDEFDKAIVLFKKYISLSEEEGISAGIRTGNNNLGLCYYDMGNYEMSLKHHLIALDLAKEPKDIATYYSNISRTYYGNNQYDKAIEYCELALKIEQENDASPESILIRAINLSSYYNDYEMADKSVSLLHKMITFNDSTIKHQLYGAYLKVNLGHAYFQLKDYKKSIQNTIEVYPIFEATGNKQLVAQLDINLAHAHSELNNKTLALKFIDKGLKAAEESGELEFKRYAYEVASVVFKNSKDYENALLYHERLVALKDSILDKDKTTAIIEMQTKYETAEKENELLSQDKELEIAAADKQRQRLVIWFIAAGLTLVLLFAIFIFYRLKISTKQKKIIETKSKENELLLGEIHHRVKNNLQVISSLLSLQEKSLTDVSAKKAILEGKERVKSMGLIHKMLYQNDNFSGVEMNDYIEKLMSGLMDSFGLTDKDLKLDLNFPPLKLDVDSAIPLGLIINELAINAMKYAFEKTENPQFSVKLNKQNNQLELLVADNGSGKVSTIENSNSFGNKLIKSLVRQLNGNILLEENHGLQYKISIKDFKLI